MSRALIIVIFVVVVISFCKRNDLNHNLKKLHVLQQAPEQKAMAREAFKITMNDRTYQVKPLFDYTLYGLVVSYKFHDGNFGLHKKWGDHLNVADICVVWQDSAFNEFLGDLNFWNGEFSCNVEAGSDKAWSGFKLNQLSNNHLITESRYIRDKINMLSIGDQIKISGWLASYENEEHFIRGTSTTREDAGDGACETIYVNDFEILSHYTSIWKKLMYGALIALFVSVVVYFRKPFRVF